MGEIEAFCTLDLAGKQFMQWVFEKFSLSIRAYNRILRVARTIADLAGSSTIKEEHLAETIQYRALDRPLNWE